MKGDYCTREGAEKLKAQIEMYWRKRGKQVEVYLVSAGFLPSMRGSRTDVRSNMINGVPVRTDACSEKVQAKKKKVPNTKAEELRRLRSEKITLASGRT